MSARFRWLKSLLLLLLCAGALAAMPEPEVAQRLQSLAGQLRCPVCVNQSVAESDAALAAQWRTEIRRRLAAGESDAQILQFFASQYGEHVLYRPPLGSRTWVLWYGPPLFLLLALWVFLRRLKPARRPQTDERIR